MAIAGSIVDDAAKTGPNCLGIDSDNTAATPECVQTLAAAREWPLVWTIARGTVINKTVILHRMLNGGKATSGHIGSNGVGT